LIKARRSRPRWRCMRCSPSSRAGSGAGHRRPHGSTAARGQRRSLRPAHPSLRGQPASSRRALPSLLAGSASARPREGDDRVQDLLPACAPAAGGARQYGVCTRSSPSTWLWRMALPASSSVIARDVDLPRLPANHGCAVEGTFAAARRVDREGAMTSAAFQHRLEGEQRMQRPARSRTCGRDNARLLGCSCSGHALLPQHSAAGGERQRRRTRLAQSGTVMCASAQVDRSRPPSPGWARRARGRRCAPRQRVSMTTGRTPE